MMDPFWSRRRPSEINCVGFIVTMLGEEECVGEPSATRSVGSVTGESSGRLTKDSLTYW